MTDPILAEGLIIRIGGIESTGDISFDSTPVLRHNTIGPDPVGHRHISIYPE
jgi:hypothetical protein